jgi:hypothetical protein
MKFDQENFNSVHSKTVKKVAGVIKANLGKGDGLKF